ncbi:MAG: molybdenum cofactor cytidylyltransferase [Thermodesulfobacteriota bacterium]
MGIRVSAILLGAGESKRMGVDKLSLPWGRETVLEHCFKTLLQSDIREVVVVLSERNKNFKDRFQGNKVKVVVNPNPERGMSSSIKRGIKAIDPKSQGILIALGDQPFLKTRTINALIHAFSSKKGKIVVPSYEGTKGNPVLFDRCYREELLSLEGDVGGRSIVEKFSKNVRLLRTKSKGVVRDIDTWEDYKEI